MKVLVGMSGGVDSSVVTRLLKEQGHEVIGATMSVWDKETFHFDDRVKACFSPHEEDIKAARELCDKIGIKHYVIDCTKEYQRQVLTNFKQEYLAGRTPNPCVVCNEVIKFSVLPESAKAQGVEFDKFATGHYARVSYNEEMQRYQLQRGKDDKKDQSYFLYRLSQEQLSKIMFPLGELSKVSVREIAREYGLAVSEKPDSQDFYTGDINDILQTSVQVGNFVTSNGKILGQHQGIWNYTVGQRRGLGISAEHPLYVIGLNKEKNEVIVGFEDECYKESLMTEEVKWSSIPRQTDKLEVLVKLRSSQKPVPALLIPREDNTAEIRFNEKQKAVAAGQSAVFYNEEGYVLGGGVIKK